MKLVTLFLLLLPATRVELVDQVVTIPRADWRYVEVILKQTPVVVNCSFQVQSPGSGVHLSLLTRADLDRLRAGQPHGSIVQTPLQTSGTLHYLVRVPGEYALVADNRTQPAPAQVHLRASLDFSGRSTQGVRYLSPGRRLAVIVISFVVFFGIVTWSARKLLRAVKH